MDVPFIASVVLTLLRLLFLGWVTGCWTASACSNDASDMDKHTFSHGRFITYDGKSWCWTTDHWSCDSGDDTTQPGDFII